MCERFALSELEADFSTQVTGVGVPVAVRCLYSNAICAYCPCYFYRKVVPCVSNLWRVVCLVVFESMGRALSLPFLWWQQALVALWMREWLKRTGPDDGYAMCEKRAVSSVESIKRVCSVCVKGWRQGGGASNKLVVRHRNKEIGRGENVFTQCAEVSIEDGHSRLEQDVGNIAD